MPIAKPATTLLANLDDAPRAPHAPGGTQATRDEVVATQPREPSAPEALDESLDDPYDNVACTD